MRATRDCSSECCCEAGGRDPRRAVARWQLGNSPSARDRFSEDGDTLIEVLLSVVVLGIAAVALLTGFATAITASAEHRHLASLDSSTRIAANEAIADVQQQAQNPANNPFLCANTFTPTFTNLTGSFTVTSTVLYWNGSGWGSGCTNYAPQQYTLTVTATGSGADSTVVTTVIYDPSAPPPPNGVGTPVQLVWLQQPTSGTVGTPVTPQPEVAVEDALNNIVTSDLSSVTLVVVSGPGTFSSTCSGVESYGIVQFSDCSLNAAGTYTIKAVDSNSSVGATPTTSLTVTGAPVAKLVFTTAAVSGTASNTANLGPITVQEQDAFGNPTFAPETVNLSSSSAKGVFSLTAGGAPVTSVTIPGGAVSSVSFYYGDTIAGSPTITASSPPAVGLASGTQTETIKAGPAATFSLSTPSPTAGTAFNETITAFDQFGNTATGFTGTQCITFSGPANSPNGNAPAYPARGACAAGSVLRDLRRRRGHGLHHPLQGREHDADGHPGHCHRLGHLHRCHRDVGGPERGQPGHADGGDRVQRRHHRDRCIRECLQRNREPDLQRSGYLAERHRSDLPGIGDLHQRQRDGARSPSMTPRPRR